ncbi:hypothetical protein K461DRAFT_160613 [Myriangium duriaei CBS 260.36]|uniref:Apple domain-containing protein n=1 Tax=Myriangium duriaei CBS 260.36 TaxID=1168546 RepID=A0A9P4J420_9PEZI|nr:hypothetical protein K461DRAFT_160613 [Myriangium duriaei CBS 260.36]
MLLPQALVLATLTPLITALVVPRAGGPSFNPIPADCTVPNPLPCTSGQPPQNYSSTNILPSTSVVTAHRIYQYYLPLPDYESMANRWEGCLEQCNGLSGCVAAFMADGVPTPAGWFGTAGGDRDRACWMFNATLAEGDFTAVGAEGTGNATAGNIVCPGK